MSKHLDPENPGKFSSSLIIGLSMLRCFTSEYPVRGIAVPAEAYTGPELLGRFGPKCSRPLGISA
jgi:hypothetical protein